jgi:hypothetical protein
MPNIVNTVAREAQNTSQCLWVSVSRTIGWAYFQLCYHVPALESIERDKGHETERILEKYRIFPKRATFRQQLTIRFIALGIEVDPSPVCAKDDGKYRREIEIPEGLCQGQFVDVSGEEDATISIAFRK